MLDELKLILYKYPHEWYAQHQCGVTVPQTCMCRRLIENPNRKTEGSGLKGLMNNLPAKAGG